jgi:LAO/AO transport system kinase
MTNTPTGTDLLEAVRRGDRVALARAITLVESTRAEDRKAATELVERALPFSGNSLRLGITGIPGVGKSSLIDPLGREAIAEGHRVAVLATDPSSVRSGGSILGDKTRMEELSRSDRAFIRPTASGGTLGGVARRTRESIALCEAAGYDVILVETVGVGQSELEVDSMTDLNLLLVIPGTGDELQGIKRGIMESADVIVLTKADAGDPNHHAEARNALRNAIGLLPPRDSGRRPEVLLTDALTGRGIRELWLHVLRLSTADRDSGHTTRRRRHQDVAWLHHALQEGALELLLSEPDTRTRMTELEALVERGELGPFKAAAELLERFRTGGARLP